MGDFISHGAQLRRTLESLLSEKVRPFLRARGFTRSGRTFRRSRGPIYDMINFHGSKWNGVTEHHGFFVNVGVGSAEMDAVYLGWDNNRGSTHEYVLAERWRQLVPGAPAEVTFDETTDLEAFADMLCANLDRVLAVIDPIDCTAALVQWAIAHNYLSSMCKTCSYLVAVGDTESLTRYVATIRDRYHTDSRWPLWNSQLLAVTGPMGANLVKQGLLDIG